MDNIINGNTANFGNHRNNQKLSDLMSRFVLNSCK